MPYIPNEALTREQGEQIIDVLKGEEPKEYGYPYTNEVLNKEQGDRIIKAFKTFKDGIPTEGLPDPSELPDGTAMVVVNGEWKMQEGYGYVVDAGAVTYSGEGISDGDNLALYTERIAIIGEKYDVIIDGQTYSNIECVDFNSMAYLGGLGEDGYPSYDVYPFYIMNSFNWYFNTALEGTHSVEVRLAENEYHQFDPSLIPTDKELPEVTTDDNGKFLRVVDGVWEASTVPNAGGNDF